MVHEPAACLAGSSSWAMILGAALAWGLAIALPERVEKLCVISVGHMGESHCSHPAIRRLCLQV